MIIAAKALLDHNPHPTEAEIREAISGNLCRCTGYGQIVEAIQAAAERMTTADEQSRCTMAMMTLQEAPDDECTLSTLKPLPPHNLPELRQVGKPLRRVDALGKAVGATVYAGDFSLPLMLHAKVFRSTQACARIVRLDVSKARALPGVACVLTAADLPDARLVVRYAGPDRPEAAQRLGCAGAGHPTRCVSTASRSRWWPPRRWTSRSGRCKLIEIEYEPLPGVFDPLEALQPGATIETCPTRRPSRNVVARWKIRKGDVQAGFAEADLIVENTFRVPYQEHAYLEPEAGVAWVDERGVINIRVSTQVVEHFRSIARAVGVPQNQIRIQGTMVGGGFGGKEDITVEIYLALLAKATQRPVRLVYTARNRSWRTPSAIRTSSPIAPA